MARAGCEHGNKGKSAMRLSRECRFFYTPNFRHDLLSFPRIGIVQRNDEASPDGQLTQQRLRDEGRAAGHQNPVKRREHRLAFEAIAIITVRPEAHLLEERRGRIVQRFLPFDAVHFVAHGRQYGTLVAAARSDFEHIGPFG